MANQVIRPAVPGDADTLTRIALAAKAHWGYSQDLLDLWAADLAVDPESCDGESVWVLERDGVIVGFGEVLTEGTTAVLDDLWIDPAHIGQGFGKILFQHLKSIAAQRGANRMTIESDPYAEGFYRHMGARVIGEIASTSIPGRVLPLLQVDLEPPENTTISTER